MKDAVKKIMDTVADELVITSAGTISREVFAYRDRPENLYLMGAMGCTLGVGIGLALNTEKDVMVIAGDGDILMSLGTMVLQHYLHLSNIKLYILNNNSYASTGGQLTCFNMLGEFGAKRIVDIETIKVSKTSNAPRIPLSCKEIKERFYESIKK